MSEQHQFEVSVASELGVNCAVILHMFAYWIKKNVANERHYHDGHYWTYNSNTAFQRIYPYMSEKAIRTALKKLKDGGYIMVGDYNPDRMKRPNWYTITDKGYMLLNGQNCQKGQHDSPLGAERAAPRGDTLNIDIYSYSFTDSSTSNSTGVSDQKDDTYSEEIAEVVDHLNTMTGKSYKAKTESTRKLIRARLRDGYTVEDCKRVIDVKVSQWLGTDWEKFLRPSTLFRGTNFEGYVNEKSSCSSLSYDPQDYMLEEWEP